ncbi:MAG TPA: four-carbon acid sugar kinase family protein [Mucilaginibacter sp.]|nr:four-carbon acid sugar kinase family protein [Mucilaginibacter sp.]
MIVVIADDLTGAAEIGGIGLTYDLKPEIVCGAELNSAADLLIIATDTRSMPEKEALDATERITKKIAEIKPELIFKKVDSVLRGHVIVELAVHLKTLQLNTALLVPANPALGRTIENGRYFINGHPVHLTSFGNDPEFSITHSEVHSMLRVDKNCITIRKKNDLLPEHGITVGECVTCEDLAEWVTRGGKNTLLAGGAGLFKALLESLGLRQRPGQDNERGLTQPALFVCGTTFSKSQVAVAKVSRNGGPVSYMPHDIITMAEPHETLFDRWAAEIISLLEVYGKAVIAIHPRDSVSAVVTASSLRNKKANVVKKVFDRTLIKELLIEGGSTAAAIVNNLKFNRLYPVNQLGPGVIKLKAGAEKDLFLTLKPGSYDWPFGIWNF